MRPTLTSILALTTLPLSLLIGMQPTPSPSETSSEAPPATESFANLGNGNTSVGIKRWNYNPERHSGRQSSPQVVTTATPRIETIPCFFNYGPQGWADAQCRNNIDFAEQLGCTPDQTVEIPSGRREFDEELQRWGTWSQVGRLQCVDPAAEAPGVDEIGQAVEREFATLPITPSPLLVQPPNGWTFVNVPTIVYSDDGLQVLTTTLLGTDIEVEVRPQSFTWDFGDEEASPFVSADPGAPYPNHTIEHTYTRTGEVTITLTTKWSGRFRISGASNWTPITGTTTTTSTASPLEVAEARARLVEDPLSN